MDKKGPIWLIIFFLIIMFVLLNTLSITAYSTPFKVVLREQNDRLSLADIHQIKAPANAPGQVYQAFTIEQEQGLKAIIDVNKAWLEQYRIADDAITVYLLTDEGWVERETTLQKRYDKENVYEATGIHGGTYVVSGQPDTKQEESKLPSTKTQLGILIILIIILLFIKYHHFGSQELKNHAPTTITELNIYIRECLLAKHDEKDIRQRLISAGWKEADVDQGLRRARFF